ncbi:retrovirus-related pol polyprotein from transposon TNT 1-94 [Tanacetum coccineum]
MDSIKPRVLATGRYAIYVEPIPPRNRNNREVHLDYLKHLKKSVETLREIVEEAKIPKQVKQVWKATGKVLTSVGYQWRPMGRIFTLGEQCPLTRLTKPKVMPATQTKNAVLVRLPTSPENQAIAHANQQEPKKIRDPSFQTLHLRLFSNAGRTNHPLVFGLRVYYVEGLGHNLFSIGKFCDSDLEVAFRKHSCYVRDIDRVELIKGSRGFNLYTISVEDMMKSSPICLLSKASKNKSWLCTSTKKEQKEYPQTQIENTNLEVLNIIHIDLCGPMRVQTINRKKYILVIVDDYSSIFHQKLVPRTSQQNGIVDRRNRTLVEAARTMLIFSKALMFLWAEVVATACYTQNRSLIHTRHNKTSYELVHNKKPDLTFFRVFGALCYPTNDSEDLWKLQPTADIGISVGYAPSRKEPPRIERSGFSAPAVPVSSQVRYIPLNHGCTFYKSFNHHLRRYKSPRSHQGVVVGSPPSLKTILFATCWTISFVKCFVQKHSSESAYHLGGMLVQQDTTHVSQPHHHLGK